MNTSRLRQRINLHFRDLAKVKDELAARRPVARGIVYVLKRKCGKAGCRCQKGKLHPQICLAWREEGRGRLRPLKAAKEINKYERLTANHRRFRKARARFIKLSKEVVALANKLEQEMLKKGDKR